MSREFEGGSSKGAELSEAAEPRRVAAGGMEGITRDDVPGAGAASLQTADAQGLKVREAYGGMDGIMRKAASTSMTLFAWRKADAMLAGLLASPEEALASAAQDSGQTASGPIVQRVAKETGADLSNVRIHTGQASEEAAAAIQAKAYTVGQDIHFGAGQYQPGTREGDHLLAHELVHTVQQRGASAGPQMKLEVSQPGDAAELEADAIADRVMSGNDSEPASARPAEAAAPVVARVAASIQRAPIDEVRAALSTDGIDARSKALMAFNRLNLDLAALKTCVAQLTNAQVVQIFDELNAVKTTDKYAEILLALGPEKITVISLYLRSVARGGDVAGFMTALGRFPTAEQVAWCETLETHNILSHLIGNSNDNARTNFWLPLVFSFTAGTGMTAKQRKLTDRIFMDTDAAHVVFLTNVMMQRFGVIAAPSSKKGTAWDGTALQRCYGILTALPDSHVAGLKTFDQLTSYAGDGEGWYGGKEVAIGYDKNNLGETNEKNTHKNDPLEKVNRFNETVRHEVGHAVDEQLGASKGGGYCFTGNGGNWKDYKNDYLQVVLDMIDASNSHLKAWPMKNLAALELTGVLQDRKPDEVEKRMKAGALSGETKDEQKRLLSDPVIEAIKVAFKTPWYSHSEGGIRLGAPARIYQESYDGQWTSYEHGARARKVSPYQFRAPGEWFAEAYAAYYEPTDTRGEKLQARDGTSKTWFDNNVHTMASSR